MAASALVIAEIAVAMVLLTASGLLLRSFAKMREVELGFRPDHTVAAEYSLPRKQYSTQAAVDGFDNELMLRLRQLPGVSDVGLTSRLPRRISIATAPLWWRVMFHPKEQVCCWALPRWWRETILERWGFRFCMGD